MLKYLLVVAACAAASRYRLASQLLFVSLAPAGVTRGTDRGRHRPCGQQKAVAHTRPPSAPRVTHTGVMVLLCPPGLTRYACPLGWI
jgi:hypothetical protein